MSTGRVTGAVSLPGLDVSIQRPGLYVVATPIGNLGDLTMRGAAVLAAVDVILSEDTRHSRRLLDHYGIATPLEALHEHNEDARSDGLVRRLRERRQAAALISDAGTPLISDPGYVLVRAARAAGLGIYTVPGPCAAIAALSVSGLPTDRFVFEGFLPGQTQARATRLAALAGETRTLVFYEAPHRIEETVADLAAELEPGRTLVIARELTKLFESIVDLPLAEAAAWLAADADRCRGEFVLCVSAPPPAEGIDQAAARVLDLLLAELPLKQAVKLAAEISGASKNALYDLALEKRRED